MTQKITSSSFSTSSEDDETEHAYALFYRWRNPELGSKEIVEVYDDDSEEYEKAVKFAGFEAPLHLGKALADLYSSNGELIKILDVGAGTGLVSIELSRRGFKAMDALDGSKGMLEEAKKKNLYENYIHAYIDGSELDIEDNTYDVITLSATFHLIMKDREKGFAGISELIRLAKPGGVFVISDREQPFPVSNEAIQQDDDFMDNFEKEGKWKLEEKITFEHYATVFGKIEKRNRGDISRMLDNIEKI